MNCSNMQAKSLLSVTEERDLIMEKYALNKNTGKLHIIGGCCHSKNVKKPSMDFELFKTEDEAISKHQNYISYCKICFKVR